MITVKVCGSAGTGKTTIVDMLNSALTQSGFVVNVIDEDISKENAPLGLRLRSVIQRDNNITLESVQLLREHG